MNQQLNMMELPAMDNIRILAKAANHQWDLDVSRVPVVGEHIVIEDRVYSVRIVVHTPGRSRSAEINVALIC